MTMEQTMETAAEEKAKTGFRVAFKNMAEKMAALPNNMQTVHTPFELCEKANAKLEQFAGGTGSLMGKDVLSYTAEFIEVLIHSFGADRTRIDFKTDCEKKAKVVLEHPRFKGVNVKLVKSLLEEDRDMKKYDVIEMNPPYQAPKAKEHEGRGKCGKSLWEDFVAAALDGLKPNGFLIAIHPSRWRKPESDIGAAIRQKDLQYLEIHGVDDGMKNFGCFTRYDWYILQNRPYAGKTQILDQKGEFQTCDLSKMPFIPNARIPEVMKLVAKDGEEKVELLWNCKYHTQTREQDGTMQKEKQGKFKHPCVYSISKTSVPTFWHASFKEQYFGVPKAIFVTGRSTGMIEDPEGKYGLTQFASGIVDNPANIKNIVKAMRSQKFFEITDAMSTATSGVDKDIIATFRKDFWKDFI